MANMISEMAVSMLHEFCVCVMARRAISDIGEDKIMFESESMKHNLSHVMVRLLVVQIPEFAVVLSLTIHTIFSHCRRAHWHPLSEMLQITHL